MTFYVFHPLIEPAATGATVLTAFGQLWDGDITIVVGTTCWGHDTGVEETNSLDLSTWTGTGTVSGSGDAEKLELDGGQYMESPIIETGEYTITLLEDKYGSGAGSAVLKYKTAATSGGIAAAEWNTYSTPFVSLGYAQLRLEH